MRTVGVLLGGKSSEREISLRSGRAISRALSASGLNVVEVDTRESLREQLARVDIDIAFIALHGKGGEDGKAQKILEELNIPYTGSDSQVSALAFDKGEMKKIFLKNGIPTPRYCVVTKSNWKENFDSIQFPVFVKPLREGSSIGCACVSDLASLTSILNDSFLKYPRLLLEERIFGRELTVGILGDRALPVIELLPKRSFFDFKAKYTKGMTDYVVPARLGRYHGGLVQEIALRAHTALGLRDFSRVDMFLDQSGQPCVLEVNSIPGFTETSLLPKAAHAIGLDFSALTLRILELAWARQKDTAFLPLDEEAFSV